MLTEHKEVCLDINDAHSVRLEEWATGFKNCLKQIPVPFKVYVDFECNLECVESYGGSYPPPKISRSHFAYKLVCVDDKFSKLIVVL